MRSSTDTSARRGHRSRLSHCPASLATSQRFW
ncbi:Uncharacterised protein [Bordetella pertussis]|nr:Uncharacterised protein [Bordetella pertussis]